MKFLEYTYSEVVEPGWHFQKMNLRKINLLVGQSAVGKSRFLNTITNLSKFISGESQLTGGGWDIKFSNEDIIYSWSIKAHSKKILEEKLTVEAKNGTTNIIIDRTEEYFKYNGKKLPKLDLSKLSITLLKNEDKIHPIYNGFLKIYRRNFFGVDLENQTQVSEYNEIIEKDLASNPRAIANLPVSTRLLYLKNKNKKAYDYILKCFQEIFPFIQTVEIQDIREFTKGNLPSKNLMPVVTFKESSKQKKPIVFMELSSGMQKVLLILTDIFSMAEQSVYLIDEYENSLGDNAINFFPEFLTELSRDNQYLITSHHPYLINTIPIDNWQVFQRDGLNVKIMNGSDLSKKYGKSKQKAFTQLINDDIFIDGVK